MSSIISNIKKSGNFITVINGVLIATMLYTPISGFGSMFPKNTNVPYYYSIDNQTNNKVEKFKDEVLNNTFINPKVNANVVKPNLITTKGIYPTSKKDLPVFANLELDKIYPTVSIIGNDNNMPDDPKDNIFNFEVPVQDVVASLYKVSFDVFGLDDESSIPLGVNAHQSIGGNIFKVNKEWKNVSFYINPNQLQVGLNQLNFFAPSYEVSYRIKNIVLTKSDLGFATPLKVNGFTFYKTNEINKIALNGFFDTDLYDLYINENKQEISNQNFELNYSLFKEEVNKGEINLVLKDKKGQVAHQETKKLIAIENIVEAKVLNFATTAKLANPKQKTIIELDRAKLTITENAIETPIKISIIKLGKKDIMPMPSGFKNVTKDRAAYRFLPDGFKFKDSVEIEIPYDENLLSASFDKSKMVTMYFDVQKRQWESIKIDSVDTKRKCVIAKTNHFTDYINGIIQAPESPEASAFVPTMMSDIKAADPSAEMTMISPPSASQTGEAGMSYPIKIPAGRNGMQPNISINYNSDGGTGWLGEGWDINVPAITIDTRWGVPIFNPEKETEIYSLAGEQLLHPKTPGSTYEYMPHRHEGELGQLGLTTDYQNRNTTVPKIFTFRKQGSFAKIERLGNSPSTYYWKVTGTDGIINWYGGDESGLKTTHILQQNSGNIFHWALVKTVDLHGNFVSYSYDKNIISIANEMYNGAEYFYINTIRYTNDNNTESGKYTVTFNKSNSIRTNPKLDFKFGKKIIDCYLLENIIIKYENDIIRKYITNFNTGRFNKKLLNKITETNFDETIKYDTGFYYHDDIQLASRNEDIFSQTPQIITLPNNNPNYRLGFGNLLNPSKINTTENVDYGFRVRVGAGMQLLEASNGPEENIMVGTSYSKNWQDGTGKITLADMDGDGLDDIVLRKQNGLIFHKNQVNDSFSNFFNNNTTPIIGVADFYKNKGKTTMPMFQNVDVKFSFLDYDYSYNYEETYSDNETSVYLNDANQDGLTDVVWDNKVYFNSKNLNPNNPQFSVDSQHSENMVITADTNINYTITPNEPITANENGYEVVRVFKIGTHVARNSKFKDSVFIENISNYSINNNFIIEYKIEYYNGTSISNIYLEQFSYNDFLQSSSIPIELNLPIEDVSKDYLFVRYRIKECNSSIKPIIRSTPSVSLNLIINEIFNYNSTALSDFNNTINFENSGNLAISWDAIPNLLLRDDIKLRIVKIVPGTNNPSTQIDIISPITVLKGQSQTIPLGSYINLPITENDKVKFIIESDSYQYWENIKWYPKISFIALNSNEIKSKKIIPQKTSLIKSALLGNHNSPVYLQGLLQNIPAVYKITNFNFAGANLNLLEGKKFRMQLIKDDVKQNYIDFEVINGQVTITNGVTLPYTIITDTPTNISNFQNFYYEIYSMDFESNQLVLNEIKKILTLFCNYSVHQNGNLISNDGWFTNKYSYYKNPTPHLGFMHNNWGQFLYNPLLDPNPNTPVDANGDKLINIDYVLNPTFGINSTDLSGCNSSLLSQQQYQDCVNQYIQSLNPSSNTNVLNPNNPLNSLNQFGLTQRPLMSMYPKLKIDNNGIVVDEKWIGMHDAQYSNKNSVLMGTMEQSSDFNNIIGNTDTVTTQQTMNSNTGMYAVNKISHSKSISTNHGSGSLNYTNSRSEWSDIKTDFMDLNGDGYPEIIVPNSIYYSTPTGGHQNQVSGLPNDSQKSDSNISTFGFSKNYSSPSVSVGNNTASSSKSNEKTKSLGVASARSGYSLSTPTGGETKTIEHYMDVNGDGIPDRIFLDSNIIKIQLVGSNTFSSPINLIDLSSVSKPSDLAYSLSTSFNLSSILESNFSFGLNFGFNANGNGTNRTFRDLNGDGLIDIFNNGTALLNNNGNFDNLGQTLTIPTLQNDGSNKSIFVSGDLSYYHGFSICCWIIPILYIKFGATLGGNANLSINANEKDFRDLNGDGFLDYIEYIGDNKLSVRYSEIKRTNKLKTVINPLQGSFTLDYQPIKKTVENPHPKWVLSSVSIINPMPSSIVGNNFYNQLNANNINTYTKTFEYQYPYYDRREREFYGFGIIKTNDIAGTTNNGIYRTTTNFYHTENYFLKGYLYKSQLSDANGLLSQTANTYELRKLTADNQKIAGYNDILKVFTIPAEPITYDVGGREGRRTAVVLQTATKSQNFETGGSMISENTLSYDDKGRVIEYNHIGNPTDNTDNYKSTITYHQDQALIDKNIIKIPQSIKVFDNNNVQKRERQTSNINLNNGQIGTISAIAGNQTIETNVEYFPNGNLKKVIKPEFTNNNNLNVNRTFEYEYDLETSKYIIQTTDNVGYVSKATYDHRFDKVLTTEDITGNKMEYTFDSFGRTKTIKGPKEIANNIPFAIKFNYFPTQQVFTLSYPFTPYAVTEHYDPNNPDNTLNTITFIDKLGRPLAVKKDVQIGEEEIMSVSGFVLYDALGRVVKEYQTRRQPLNNGNSTLDNRNFYSPSTGINNKFIEKIYDTRDRVIEVKDFDPNSWIKNEYSIANGLFKTKTITKQNNATNLVSESYTDVNGRTTSTKQISPTQSLETNYTYNAIGELLSYKDADNITTSYQYDGFGRKIQITHPDQGISKFYYDKVNLIKMQTQKLIYSNQFIEYFYDNANRLINQQFPPVNGVTNIANTTFEYGAPNSGNQSGRLIHQTDATGNQIFEYGNMGEMIYNRRNITSPTTQFNDQVFETSFNYDTWNRLTDMTYPDGEKVNYTYDLGGNLNSISSDQQKYVKNITYDHFEQRTSITYGNDAVTNYTYTPDLRRLSNLKLDVNGGQLQNLNYTYDAIGNVTNIVNNASPIENIGGNYQHNYIYDGYNRLATANGNFAGATNQNNNQSSNYTLNMAYNNTHGIVNKNQNHTLDGVIYHRNTYNNDYSYSNNTHRVNKIINQNNGYTQYLIYDANGNLSIHENGKLSQSYYWDEVNRLRVVRNQNIIQHNFYDASGERIIKSNGDAVNVYENGQLIDSSVYFNNYTLYPNAFHVENLSDNNYTKHYYAGSQRIAANLKTNYLHRTSNNENTKKTLALQQDLLRYFENDTIKVKINFDALQEEKTTENSVENAENINELYFYHPDHLGSATFLTDKIGKPYSFYLNLPFGEQMAEQRSYTGSFNNRWKFTGKELDEETGLYYFGARFYNPVTSLWLSVDPKASQMPAWSPYSFCFNNPLIFVDPDGQYPIYILTRSYAPFSTFGPSNRWHGDSRGATLDRGASYRSLASINYDTETRRTQVFGGHSRSYTTDGTQDATSSTLVYNRSKGNNIDVHSAGRNEAQTGSFDIDQFTKLKVTTDGNIKGNHVLNIQGAISGDDFPNQESMIYDSKGNGLWLGNYETKGDRQSGPVTDLPFENEGDVQINVNIRISVNKDGVFQGVMQKGKDGKESMISIGDWNKKFKSDDNK